MFPQLQIDQTSGTPIYRQVYDQIRLAIKSGVLRPGDRLPPTRELAGALGLNRQTISSAYEMLEADVLVSGQVGRGSFVTDLRNQATPTRRAPISQAKSLVWESLLAGTEAFVSAPMLADVPYSFAASRPSELLFPLADFRSTAMEVIGGPAAASILQLGSPYGYGPLRRYLLEEARREGIAREVDDILITNGCQQALDLLHRTLCPNGEACVVEDPVYPGLRSVLGGRAGAAVGVPLQANGIDIGRLEFALAEHRPRIVFLTPDFQNPTGATMPLAERESALALCRNSGAVVVEIDIYRDLRYRGESLSTLKKLDQSSDVVIIRSFSKLAFPGLRVGWIIAPKPLIKALAAAKRSADLHTDQLSQAILLAFAESGKLKRHRDCVVEAGRQRMDAVVEMLPGVLPAGSQFTRPEGGMNIWVTLPDAMDSSGLLSRAQQAGVSYLPGKYFSAGREHSSSLRISFTGLDPSKIREGLGILGEVLDAEWNRMKVVRDGEPQPVLV